MAIVDSLLKLITVRGADTLILQSSKVPFLLKGSAKVALTMPPIGADVLDTILGEVGRERDGYPSHYRCDGQAFALKVAELGGGHKLTFRLDARPPAGPQVAAHRPEQGLPAPSPPATAGPSSPAPPDPAPPDPARLPAGATAIAELLQRAAQRQASDVLLSSDAPPRARIGGRLEAIDPRPTDDESLLAFLESVMTDGERAQLEAEGSVDLGLSTRDGRYRVNLFKQDRGLAAAFRPIGAEVPTLHELGLPSTFHELVAHHHGLVLMVGATGSGKSTTLCALIEHLNRNADKHIVTLEDPIEYQYRSRRCLIHQREVGRHVASFGAGLRAALRESPDVILVGEMRDRETIAAALTAAETGHLVLSTLHSANAATAVDRIVDVFSEYQQTQVRYQLANVLRAIVTQILVPSSRAPGRVPAFERLNVTAAVSTKIRDNRTHQMETELQRGRAEGMVPMELSLARLVRQRLITAETAKAHAQDPLLLEQLVRSER